MTKLKIKLWRVENIVLMKVLEQDESIREPKNEEIFEFGGMTLKSRKMPEILPKSIYIRGSHKERDNEVVLRPYDDSGYKATAKVVVKNGKVYSVDCDADSKDGGTKKAHAESGKYDMKKGGAQYGWHEEIAFFERYVTEKGVDAVSLKGDGKTDVITGCTIAVSDYVDLINEALNKAKK